VRKFADFAIITSFLGISAQYALDGRWWVVLACVIVGALWFFQSHRRAELGLDVSLLFLAGAGCAGIFMDHNQVWTLTSLVILLVAWDLDHFSRDLQQYSRDNNRAKSESVLIQTHLKRLGITVGLGWGLGVVALELRVSIGFAGAVVLASLALLVLRQVVQLLRREAGDENPSKHISA